jgi:hypothetical protein
MAIHLNKNGKAKCGATPWSRYSWLNLTDDKKQVDCKRCLGTVKKPAAVAKITENMIGKIFHTSWGYDMTINEYVKVIGQTDKSLLVQECTTASNGLEYAPGSVGKAWAGGLKKDGKQFRLFRRVTSWGDYWKGSLHSSADIWSLWDGTPDYENHLD